MNNHSILEQYINLCHSNLLRQEKIINQLRRKGITESYIFTNFNLGFSNISLPELIGNNPALEERLNEIGILKNGKEVFPGCMTIPLFDEEKIIKNIAFYNLHPNCKEPLNMLNDEGIFNAPFLKNGKEIVFSDNPIDALLLIQNSVPYTTFFTGKDDKYVEFLKEHGITRTVFTLDGKAKLFYQLTSSGISSVRIPVDYDQVRTPQGAEYLAELFENKEANNEASDDIIQEIENGFLFSFNHLSYRVIGNFSEFSMNMKVNIKAFTDSEVFVDSVDLYKNRDRQNLVFNIMDRFNFRDQVQLENDLNQIISVVEKHKENRANEKKKSKPELTDFQKDIGTTFLKNPKLIDEIEEDITQLGYVRERKNKILMYLLMTSRLLENPLHAVIISRSGAGKSQIVDIVETLCPPESLESVSDLSSQSLYYYGENDLKNKFVVIGEKEGSKGADYPLRELISKKSITKAIPMKDPVTGQIKTATIKVNGPIALVETTTNGEVNPENLNRCFVIGIDESEEQTQLIHQKQRERYTLESHLQKKQLNKIREKHIYAGRLLEKVHVFNPFAPLLTFPSGKLKSRRDNEKLLRLIIVICFLHQFQRKKKKMKLDNNEVLEYIECTIHDYRIAYDLLSDGVLENTLDDLPRPARELLELIKKYLKVRSEKEENPIEKLIFTRKDIREYTSWSFAQVRNNIRILKDYEYVQTVKAKAGTAEQYKLSAGYNDLDFLNTILSPEQLDRKIKEVKEQAKNKELA